jgi:hypothetical protein
VIASFLSSENQRGESIIRRDKPPMLTQSQSLAQQSPPSDQKKGKFPNPTACALSACFSPASRRHKVIVAHGRLATSQSKVSEPCLGSHPDPSGELFAASPPKVNWPDSTYAHSGFRKWLRAHILRRAAKLFVAGEPATTSQCLVGSQFFGTPSSLSVGACCRESASPCSLGS